MKTIFIVNQFANTPDLPGHTRQFELAIGLQKKGWNVEVFSSDFNLSERIFKKLNQFQLFKFELIKRINWFWIRVLPYKKNNIFRYLNIFSFCINVSLLLIYRILENKINPNNKIVILASSPQLPATFFCLLIAKLFGVPFLSEIRDLWPQVLIDLGGKSPNSLLIRFLSFLEKKIYELSNHVIVLAKGSIEYVKERGAKNISFLPNGSDLKHFKYYDLNPEKNGFSNKRPFTLIYYGAHGEANGLENIIEAGKKLKNKPIKFILVGDGPEKISLIKKSINLENIVFLPTISKEKMPELISKCDAVIITLKDIPLFKYGVSPNKLYDAYAIGRPVISNVGGYIGEEINHYKIGFDAYSKSQNLLSDSITKLMNISKEERQKMSKRARELAEKTYSREIIVSKYDSLLNKYISK